MANFIIRFCIVFVFTCIVTACSSSKKEFPVLKEPKWINEESKSSIEGFSAIGSTDRRKPLKTILFLAENDAISKIKKKLAKKVDAFFVAETSDLNRDKKRTVLNELSSAIDEALTISYLKSISRRDNFWKHPRTSISHVNVIVDKQKITEKIVYILDEIQKVHVYDSDIVNALNRAKNDIIYNNFKVNIDNGASVDPNN